MEEAESNSTSFQRPHSCGIEEEDKGELIWKRALHGQDVNKLVVCKATAKAAWDFLLEKKKDVPRFTKYLCDPKVITRFLI